MGIFRVKQCALVVQEVFHDYRRILFFYGICCGICIGIGSVCRNFGVSMTLTPPLLPTCSDINSECDNEPCMFEHDHKCTFYCRQWKHIDTTNPSVVKKLLMELEGDIKRTSLTGFTTYTYRRWILEKLQEIEV